MPRVTQPAGTAGPAPPFAPVLPPPPAPRLAAAPAIESVEQLGDASSELAWLEAAAAVIDADLKRALAALKDQAAALQHVDVDGARVPFGSRAEALREAAEQYVTAHRAALCTGGAKSFPVRHGTAGFRQQPATLAFLEGLDAKQALARLYASPTDLLKSLVRFLARVELLGPTAPVEVSKSTRDKLIVWAPYAELRTCRRVRFADSANHKNLGVYDVAEIEDVDGRRTCLVLAERLPKAAEPETLVTPIVGVPAGAVLELEPKLAIAKAKAARGLGQLTDRQLEAVGLVHRPGTDQFFLKPDVFQVPAETAAA